MSRKSAVPYRKDRLLFLTNIDPEFLQIRKRVAVSVCPTWIVIWIVIWIQSKKSQIPSMTSRNRSRSTLIYSKYRATQKSISNQFGAVCITTYTHALLFVSWVDAHTHKKKILKVKEGENLASCWPFCPAYTMHRLLAIVAAASSSPPRFSLFLFGHCIGAHYVGMSATILFPLWSLMQLVRSQ